MKKIQFYCLLALVFLSFIDSGHLRAQETPVNFHLIKKKLLGGQGGWDCLATDGIQRKLFIAHNDEVIVYDMDFDTIVRHIPNTDGSHGIALADREKKGFISCGHSNSVLEFNLLNFDTIKRIPVGIKPDAILYDYFSARVFVMNAGSNSVMVIDAFKGTVLDTIKLPGNPEFAVSDQHGHVYVNIEDKSEIARINSYTDSLETLIPIGSGEGPTGIAMDRGKDRIFVGCANEKLIVIDAKKSKVIETLKIGKGCDGVAFDPFSKLAFASCGDGTVTIARETPAERLEVVQTLQTQRGARTMDIDPKTHNIYLVTAEFGQTPEPTKDKPHPRPEILPGTFTLLEYGQGKR
jgi:YVTN family beta-propeller protein